MNKCPFLLIKLGENRFLFNLRLFTVKQSIAYTAVLPQRRCQFSVLPLERSIVKLSPRAAWRPIPQLRSQVVERRERVFARFILIEPAGDFYEDIGARFYCSFMVCCGLV